MKLRLSLLILLAGVATLAGGDIHKMAPFQVRPSDLVLTLKYTVSTDGVTEIRVADVARGSSAEKIGIRKGDFLTAINGVSVVGKLRRGFLGKDGRIVAFGRLTFEGKRGLFGKHWSVTVESKSLREKEPNKSPEPTSCTVMPRASE